MGENNTWKSQTWDDDGFIPLSGEYIWTDGKNIYYSNDFQQYQLDKTRSIWNAKTGGGVTTRFSGQDIWTDGTNIYYSYVTHLATQHHQLIDKANGIWSNKTWKGFTDFNGRNVWTDGVNVYYSHYANGENDEYQVHLTPSAQVGTRTYIESYSLRLGHI